MDVDIILEPDLNPQQVAELGQAAEKLGVRALWTSNYFAHWDCFLSLVPLAQTTSTLLRSEYFLLDADVTPLFTVPPGFIVNAYPDYAGTLQPDQSETAAAVGVLSTRSGRAGVLTFVPSRANGFLNRDRVVAEILRRVLID